MVNAGLCAASLVISFVGGAYAYADEQNSFWIKTFKLIAGIISILSGTYCVAMLELLIIGGETLEIGRVHFFALFIAGIGLSFCGLAWYGLVKNKRKHFRDAS
jgi:hypothetical protein